ncbi:MAG TPA: class II aldolase/adducin family protein [Candidatus Limnocylindrales bacterium]|nr:class II aldolase/adducin family protein [Candidatus Limnocylindrales bacterium]
MSYLRKLLEGATVLPFVRLPLAGRPLSPELQLRHDLVDFGRMLHHQGFVAATDGNLSVRMDDDRIMITPTGVSKGMMRPEEMVIVDMQGKKLSGDCNPSSEITMHLTIYRMRPEIGAVVHAHPCTATAFASAGLALDEPLCSEIVITLGAVPLAPYATTGTMELSDSLRPFIPDHDAILMANHGVVTYGSDIRQAYLRMEAVEHYAKIVLAARQLGCTRSLNEQQLEKLFEARSRYGKNGNGNGHSY